MAGGLGNQLFIFVAGTYYSLHNKESVVFDSSCGYGNFFINDAGCKIKANDIDKVAVEKTKATFPNTEVFNKNALFNVNRQDFGINKDDKLPYATDFIPVSGSVCTISGNTASTSCAITPACLSLSLVSSVLINVTPLIWLILCNASSINLISPFTLLSENAWISLDAYIDTPLTFAFTWTG